VSDCAKSPSGQTQFAIQESTSFSGPVRELDWRGRGIFNRASLKTSIIKGFGLALVRFARDSLRRMAKPLTKSQIIGAVAETAGLTKKQTVVTLEALVNLAYKNAKNSFTLPGLGKLVLVNRKARMGRNPATGATIKIAAKRVVKFRVAKAAKDAILGAKK
jgi:DNA-binding protein HU-beta